MLIVVSLLVAVVGVLMYALCTNQKLVEIGRLGFFCGLFTFLLHVGPTLVGIAGGK